ncbi:hypothetical protein ANO14919_026460 [Xylariales sp. No.14919]|nr:hypothetical protein ANO14919_026460 [Xylariales sp. No.14919]
MSVARSAAGRFASIEELLLILAEYVNDEATLWSLCLSNWRFNCVFTPKLAERVVVRVQKHDDEATVQRIVGGLVAGPYLHDLRHLRLIINNGPAFPETTLEMVKSLLSGTVCLKVFSWDSIDGDIPVSILVHLSENCPQLEELHLRSGPELNNYGSGFRDVLDRPTFESVRVFTCRSMGTWHALYILNQCPNVETVEMTHMGYMLALGWVHSGYHAHLRALIAREESIRAHSGKPLKMDMCYSRSMKATYDCEVCDSPGMRSYKQDDARYTDVWPWASGRARQYLNEGQVRHITYEYPNPEPAERSGTPLDE